MMAQRIINHGERGATITEFAIVGTFFFTMLFGTLELGRLLWVHNELANATRRAARYAVTHSPDQYEDAKKVAVYGNPDAGAGAKPIVPGLAVTDVEVIGSPFAYGYGANSGTVTVMINYRFNYVVPLIGTYVQLSPYRTVLSAEGNGCENFANPSNPCA